MDILKDKIVAIYKQLGITQAEFCRRTGINVSNLSTILSNNEKGVSASMIYGVSKIPNLNMNWFLKDEGSMFIDEIEEKHKKELSKVKEKLRDANNLINSLERILKG